MNLLEKQLDGKYLLSCSDHTLSPEDIALGYKQLLGVERIILKKLKIKPPKCIVGTDPMTPYINP